MPYSMVLAADYPQENGPRPAVLVVEDDVEVADVVEEILSDVFLLDVTRAQNADEALQLLGGRKFDLIFSDIVMPGSMDGVGMARKMREQFPDLPIVLTTGNTPAARLRETEAFPVLVKPYPARELRSVLRKAGLPL